MNRLPPELLGMIADRIEEDPLHLRRQRTLTALARTNKLFYSICKPRIYGRPVLGDEEMLEKWLRRHLSKVNPWTICKVPKELENVTVPESITFEQLDAQETERRNRTSSYRPPPRQLSLPRWPVLELPHTSSFFRNLVSVSISTYSYALEDFVATVVGPCGVNRSLVQQLSIGLDERSHLQAFLFEAFDRLLFSLFEDWGHGCMWEVQDEMWTLKFGDRDPGSTDAEEDWDKIRDAVWDLVPVQYSMFSNTVLYHDEPDLAFQELSLGTGAKGHPFTNLTSLSVHIESRISLGLILYSHLFPSLLKLMIAGEDLILKCPHDVKLLRHSITARKGTVLPPSLAEWHVTDTEDPDVSEFTLPLTEKEISEEPLIDYYGPNLTMLDMSKLIVSQGWE